MQGEELALDSTAMKCCNSHPGILTESLAPTLHPGAVHLENPLRLGLAVGLASGLWREGAWGYSRGCCPGR